MTRLPLLAATLVLGLAASPVRAEPAASAAPQDHAECRNGEAMALAASKQKALFELAARHWKACLEVPGQTEFMIAKARLGRLSAFEALGDQAAAEAELVALTTPPLSASRVFFREIETGTLMGALQAATGSSVQVSQARLLALRASYRLSAQDFPAAIAGAEQSLRAAIADERSFTLTDEALAHTIRAKAKFLMKDNSGVGDVVRAYVRGADDEWVVAQTQSFGPEAVAHLKALRETMVKARQDHAGARSTGGILLMEPEAREKLAADAAATIDAVLKAETGLVGPMAWSTPASAN